MTDSNEYRSMSPEWQAGYVAGVYGDTITDWDSYPDDWKAGYAHRIAAGGCYSVNATTGSCSDSYTPFLEKD